MRGNIQRKPKAISQAIQSIAPFATVRYHELSQSIVPTVIVGFIPGTLLDIARSGLAHRLIMTSVRGAITTLSSTRTSLSAQYVCRRCIRTAVQTTALVQTVGLTETNNWETVRLRSHQYQLRRRQALRPRPQIFTNASRNNTKSTWPEWRV